MSAEDAVSFEGSKICCLGMGLYKEVTNHVYASLTVEVCPLEFVELVVTILTASEETNTLLCTTPPEPPKTCDEDEFDGHLLTYQNASLNAAEMSKKCSLFKELELNAIITLEKCDSSNADDQVVIESINVKLSTEKRVLVCVDMPGFEFSEVENTLIVTEGDIPGKEISIKVDQSPVDVCDGQPCSIRISFEILELGDNVPRCSQGTPIRQLLLGSFCDIEITQNNWNLGQNVSLTAKIDHKLDGDIPVTLRMFAALVNNNVEIQRERIRDYEVIVKDKDTGNQCSNTNDPHITTFDGVAYDVHFEGEFILYRHLDHPFEVRAFYINCFGKQQVTATATCICGVMVICGDDTFTLFKCRGRNDKEGSKPTMFQNNDLMDGFRIDALNDGRTFVVRLPLGTSVKIQTESSNPDQSDVDFMNVYITPSSVDLGRTQGLCGIYNGNTDDDLTCYDGVTYNIKDYTLVDNVDGSPPKPRPDDFSICWRTEVYSFDGIPEDTPDALSGYCYRSTADPDETCECTLDDFVEWCEFPNGQDITNTMKRVLTSAGRKKRQDGGTLNGINVTISNTVPDTPPFPRNGITFSEANTTCHNAIAQSAVTDTCTEVLTPQDLDDKVTDCISDIQSAGSLDIPFIRTSVEAYKEKCLSKAVASTNNTLVQNVVDNSCSNDCSGQGNCTNGTCVCNTDYVSYDCSINVNDPPTALQLDNNLCTSVSQQACVSVNVEGDNFVSSAYCHFETVEVTETGIVRSGNQSSQPASFNTYEEVGCNVSSTGSLPLHAVLVSISNNNGPISSQSPQLLFVAHDPICWSCSVNSVDQTASCTRERASCLEDGVCYRPTDPKVNDPCYLCDAFTGTMVYFVSDACPALTTTSATGESNSEAREMDDSLVIGLSGGMAVLVLLIIGIVVIVLVLRHRRKKAADSDSLTRRSRSADSQYGKEDFYGANFQAYPNYGYYGYGPNMYLEAPPAEMFAEGIPKRQDTRHSNSRNSDPIYHSDADYYDNRRIRREIRGTRHESRT